jgi:hypothetical protein
VAIAIAHELSHVVLDSIRHPLFREEKAVDLTAMLLGFRRLYLSGAHTEKGQIGYLSEAEVNLANHLLEVSGSASKNLLPGYARLKAVLSNSLASLFAITCIVATIAIWLAASKFGYLAPTPAAKLPSRAQVKATLPQDLIDRLDKGAH